MLDQGFRNVDINYLASDLLNVDNWDEEARAICELCRLIDVAINGGKVTLDEVKHFLSYKDTLTVEVVLKTVRNNSGFILGQLILAAGSR